MSFKIKTLALIQTRQSGVEMLEWCLQAPNKYQVEIFGKKLTKDLQGMICSSIKKSYECNRNVEKIFLTTYFSKLCWTMDRISGWHLYSNLAHFISAFDWCNVHKSFGEPLQNTVFGARIHWCTNQWWKQFNMLHCRLCLPTFKKLPWKEKSWA